MPKNVKDMTIEELKAELRKLTDNLSDLQDMHFFTFSKTSIHIGAEKAQNLQAQFEEECKMYEEKIAEIETLLRERNRGNI